MLKRREERVTQDYQLLILDNQEIPLFRRPKKPRKIQVPPVEYAIMANPHPSNHIGQERYESIHLSAAGGCTSCSLVPASAAHLFLSLLSAGFPESGHRLGNAGIH